jgi:hypothetical protein
MTECPLTSATPIDALAFFDDLADAFASAAATSGLIERSYRVAGCSVRLRFAGAALMPALLPALGHRAEPDVGAAPADLTVCVWDSASTGCEMPVTRALSQYSTRGEITALNTPRIYAVAERGYPSVTLFDRARRLGLYWAPAPSALPEWVKGAPLRVLFHWCMGLRGKQLVHGAAVGTRDGGVLISARGGSGKSTTALACLASGMAYAGDDYVVVGTEPPHVANLYCTAKIAAPQLLRFPWLRDMVVNAEALAQDKALVVLNGPYAEQIVEEFPLRAILIPTITGRRGTDVRRTSAASALAALAPTTLLFHPRGGEHELKTLGELVRAVPTYVLECGTEISEIPATISAVLGDARP